MRRVRTIRYREIADALRERVVAGEFPAGRLLPSEAALSATYEASRVTIRRALELLRDEGLVDARQGFGWFVAKAPIRQSLARLATLEDQLAASGIRPGPPDPRLRLRHRGRPDAGAPRHLSGAAGAAAQPGRRRAVRHRHRLVPGRPRPAPVARRRGAVAVLRAARRATGRSQSDHRCGRRARPTMPDCWTSRPGPRCCAASASPAPRKASPSSCRCTSSRPTAPSSSSTCRARSRRSPRPGCAWSSEDGQSLLIETRMRISRATRSSARKTVPMIPRM